MSDGFLGRWSRRKLGAVDGKPADVPPPAAVVPPAAPVAEAASSQAAAPRAGSPPAGQGAPVPPPSLDDVRALTGESDFSRFAARDVAPDVKNAAMKKLFSDPRYNVMDGMDVYVGDYSQPDPIPQAMLRQLASAKFLGLFDAEERAEAEAARLARDDADNPNAQTVAQSDAAPPAVPELPDHADPDLRLQQDHAAAGKDPGRGAG